MNLFKLFKNNKCENDDVAEFTPLGNKKVAYFNKSGTLIDVQPRLTDGVLQESREVANQADNYIIDGKAYYLNDAQSVASIPAPQGVERSSLGLINSVMQLEYIFKIHVGMADNDEAIVASAFKAFELLQQSSQNNRIEWDSKSYITLFNRLMKIGKFDEAEIMYRKILPIEEAENLRFSKTSNFVTEEYERNKKLYIERCANMREYNLIQEVLPELAPKSFSGFCRMKKGNTKNYIKIINELKKLGY